MNNVRDFGAAGDGIRKDTGAIQQAIDAGGTVYFPPGIYLTGTLYLRSGGGLELAPGAVILASPDPADYNSDDFVPQNETCPREHVSGAHLIVAVEQENIFIRGYGRIDGARQHFMNRERKVDPVHFEFPDWRPAQMIYFCECRNVFLSGCEYWNSPYWTILLHGCVNADIRGLTIYNDRRTLNGDGLDIDCCRDVCVDGCRIDTGDDCITLRGNSFPLKNKQPCERVTISNCILRTRCNAIRIGVGDGIVRNCLFSNIICHDTRTAVCIVSSYSAGKSVEISNIGFSNLQIQASRVFSIKTWLLGPLPDHSGKTIRNISFNQVRGSCTCGSLIVGNAGCPIRSVSFHDVRLEFSGGKHLDEDSEWRKMAWAEFEPAAFYLENVENTVFNHTAVEWLPGHSSKWEYGLIRKNTSGTGITDCDFGKPLCGTEDDRNGNGI